MRDSAKTDAAAFERLKRLADRGDKNAQFALGTLYDPDLNLSKLTNPDVNQSIGWYTKAAEQGQPNAQFNLGRFFYDGKYVTQNFATAVFWFEKSAVQGVAPAKSVLAFCYKNGNGVAADPYKAFQWFEKAANNGDAFARNALGEAYANGRGVAQDLEKARYWFEQAKAKGNTDAAANLSRVWAAPAAEALSENDIYRLRDSAKTDAAAFERLKRLADSGDRNAQLSLGTFYDPYVNFSKLTKPDVNEAIAWYTKAAEQGHPIAQYNLGLYFYQGEYGVTKNFSTAVLGDHRVDSLKHASSTASIRRPISHTPAPKLSMAIPRAASTVFSPGPTPSHAVQRRGLRTAVTTKRDSSIEFVGEDDRRARCRGPKDSAPYLFRPHCASQVGCVGREARPRERGA